MNHTNSQNDRHEGLLSEQALSVFFRVTDPDTPFQVQPLCRSHSIQTTMYGAQALALVDNLRPTSETAQRFLAHMRTMAEIAVQPCGASCWLLTLDQGPEELADGH